jgi:hypothetical protein
MIRIRTDSENIAEYANIAEIDWFKQLAVINGPIGTIYAIFNERKLINCQ